MKEGFIPQEKRKKILLLCDDIRFTSGIATMAREIVVGTAHRFNWVNVGGAINHPEQGKRLDLSQDTNTHAGIIDSSVIIYPTNGYGDQQLVRQMMDYEKPDAIMFFTDPRYWTWLFQMENEIRSKIPMIYLNIWDDYPVPMYNEPYYESCDGLMAISKQTLNINKIALGDKIEDKILSYVPHGINENMFFPITKDDVRLTEIKKALFKGKEYEFVLMFNSRNIRRKSIPDTLAAFKLFLNKLPKEKADKCAILLHTQPIDEHGTDLYAVRDMLFTEEQCSQIYFSDQRLASEEINKLYNLSDAVILLSSNEGWGLSLTEGMMAGKMIIANVTGGMQDQMRFKDKKGNWIEFDADFCSNHFGTFKECGEWAMPVFPSNMSIQGSVPTPYIFDDRVDFRDAAEAIMKVYELGKEERERRGKLAREWVTSDESMMSANNMSKNVVNHIETVMKTFKPRKNFTLTKVETLKRKHLRHKLVY